MEDKIGIMIIDDIKETCDNIARLISLEEDLVVVGQAQDAESGIEIAKQLRPDIILLDINLPGMDGLKAAEILSLELPATGIIIISVQEEHYYMQQAMTAGARGYLMKPFSQADMIKAIRRIYSSEQKRRNFYDTVKEVRNRKGEVIVIFSGKGGVGKTTISVNLAIALAQLTGEEVVILDLDLQFGDVSLLMDLNANLTITDLAQEIDTIDENGLENYLLLHKSGVKILSAPLRPEESELIKDNYISKIIELLQKKYRFVLIDTEPTFQEVNLTAMDLSDKIFLISLLELATIKNLHLSLQVMEELKYPMEKIHLILNRFDSEYGLSMKDLEKTLNLAVKAKIPSDGGVAVRALNTGEPFVLSNPKATISRAIFDLARFVVPNITEKDHKDSLFQKMKKLFKK